MSKAKTPSPPEQEAAPLQVSGVFLKRVSQIPSGAAALVATIGQKEGSRYLLPFIDLSLDEDPELNEGEDDEEGEAFARIVTLDNAVHILRVIAVGVASAFKDYERMIGPNAGPEPTQLEAVQTYLKEAKEGIEELSADVERVMAAAKPSDA